MFCANLRKIGNKVSEVSVKTKRPYGKAIAFWEKVAESTDRQPYVATVELGFSGSESYDSLAYFVDNGLEWQYDEGENSLRLPMEEMKEELKNRLKERYNKSSG